MGNEQGHDHNVALSQVRILKRQLMTLHPPISDDGTIHMTQECWWGIRLRIVAVCNELLRLWGYNDEAVPTTEPPPKREGPQGTFEEVDL